MAEKWNFMVFRAFTSSTYPSKMIFYRGKKGNLIFKILKKSVMAEQKYKNILLQTALKGF